jgi:glycosyltransferase involved in cell wall biosynthesis
MKIFWLTNIPSAYRFKAWSRLGEESDLTVGVLEINQPNRELVLPVVQNVNIELFNCRKISIDESFIYFPNLKLVRSLLNKKPDVVIIGGWDNFAYLGALLIAKIIKSKVLIHYGSTKHSTYYKTGLISLARKTFFRLSDGVVTYGSLAGDAVVAMGVPADRVIQSFNTVDVEWFHENSLSVRSEASDGHTFIYVGRLIGLKNIESLIRAFSGLAESDRLVIVGKGQDRARLEKLSEDLGISSRVSFIGSKNGLDLVAEYGQANTLVLPSKQEVWGLVVNEALACGLHVVVSDVCGVSADTKHMNGVFVTGIDVETIREGMQSSKKTWAGHIEQPEILKHTPEQLALDILDFKPTNRNYS